MKGIVRKFDAEKGYGFIKSDEIESDIFVHFSSIQQKGYKFLVVGETVEFDYVKVSDDKSMAENVVRLGIQSDQDTVEPNSEEDSDDQDAEAEEDVIESEDNDNE